MKKNFLRLLLFCSVYALTCSCNRKICPCDTCRLPFHSNGKTLSPGDSVDVCIRADRPRNYTHVFLSRSGTYAMKVLLPDTLWCDGSLEPFNADGHRVCHLKWAEAFLRKPDALWFSLIGSTDKNPDHYFKIGKELGKFTPAQEGDLACFANDVRGFYRTNNHGAFVLRIMRLQ